MTIGELLEIEDFKKLKIINKNADLTRRIVTVESTETPDIVKYLTPNSLLLTTAMSYQNNQEDLIDLIYKLNNLPCAGLAIKLGRFIHELDQRVIQASDELGFPLLQIPLDMTLGELYHDLLSYLWDNQNKELVSALNTQKKFSNLVIQGASVRAMLNNLGHVLKQPVALMDTFGEVISYNSTCTKEKIALAERTFHEYTLYNRSSGEFAPIKDSQVEKTSIYPIKNVGQNYYYLFVFDSEDRVAASSEIVIEQVLLIFRLFVYKFLYNLGNSVKAKEDFLKILLNRYKDESWTSHQLMVIGEKYGLIDSENYRVILGTLEGYEEKKFNYTSFSNKEEQYIMIYDWMDKEINRAFNGKAILFPEASNFRFVILVQGNCPDMLEKLSDFHHMVQKIFNINMVFSYGNNMEDIASVKYSYKAAIEGYRYGESKGNIPYIKYYRPKNASELLKSLSNEQAQSFCLHVLKELAYSEDEVMLELRRTLQVYLECRGSITATARRMFLHRNTVKYRIKKCEEILGNDLSDSDYYFQLQLGLMLLENEE